MGMTATPGHERLSPLKERRNQDFFLVMPSSGRDYKDPKSGIQREFPGIGREFLPPWAEALCALAACFPADSRKFPLSIPWD